MNILKISFLILVLCIRYADIAYPQCKSGSTVFRNGLVIDGTGAEVKEDWDIEVCNGIITNTGQDLTAQENATVVDLADLTILPGLVDMHAHLYVNQGTAISNQPAYLDLFLAGGVTTIYSPGEYDPESTLELQQQIKLNKMRGPDILTAGPYFDHAPALIPWINGVNSIQELETQFNAWKDKVDGIKVYTSITESELSRLTELADQENLPITGHLGSITASKAIDLGIDGIEHGIIGMPELFDPDFDTYSIACREAELDFNDPATESLIQKIIENDVYITPTIVTLSVLSKNHKAVTEWQKYISENISESLSQLNKLVYGNQQIQDCIPNAIAKQNDFIYEIYKRSGLIVAGTDPVVPMLSPGFALHREMELLVEAGLSPMYAIQAATINAAKAIRKQDEFGSIETGKQADFLIVQGNPSENISDIGNVVMVIKGGIQYDPAELRGSSFGKIGSEK